VITIVKKTNKETGDIAEKFVVEWFKKKGIKAYIEKGKKGYDVKAGNKLIEVKGSDQSFEQKTFFKLNETQYNAVRKNKNYWLYWVDTKKMEMVLEINRKEILENAKPSMHFDVYLSKLKKKKIRNEKRLEKIN